MPLKLSYFENQVDSSQQLGFQEEIAPSTKTSRSSRARDIVSIDSVLLNENFVQIFKAFIKQFDSLSVSSFLRSIDIGSSIDPRQRI